MITIISGTNREQSLSKTISLYYQHLLNNHGVESQVLDLRELPHDFIQTALYGNSGKNQAFNEMQALIDLSQKFVFVVPEYNGSYPGVLKAFVDGLKHQTSFSGKKGALVGVATGVQGGATAISHFGDVLSYMGMDLVGLRIKLSRIHDHLSDGKITLPIYNQMLETQIERLIAL